jgi:two-component system, sensor histidine kinase and response regulator
MIATNTSEERVTHLEARVRYLEEANRWILDSLDMMASLGDFQSSVQFYEEPGTILRASWPHLKRLMAFHTMAFYLVDEADHDFHPALCTPALNKKRLQEEVNLQIEEGTFAWALHQNRVVLVPTRKFGHTVVFQALATRNRILGMFAGILADAECHVTEVSKTLLSIFILNTAYLLETSGLHKKIHDHNRNLERLVQERTCQLQRAREQAETANVAKSQFLANISHEIRTPLNGIMGLTELVLEMNLPEEEKESLQLVSSSAKSLLETINDILDFSNIEAKKTTLQREYFNLRTKLGEVIGRLAIPAQQKKLELICSVAQEVPAFLLGDAPKLLQILNHLLSNAIKFTQRGEVELRVTGACPPDAPSAKLHFCVRDTGIGIPLDKQQLIFEAFAQADGSSTRQFGGTGLGLTIASRLVNMMEGEIWLVSEEGRGSEFHFEVTFPVPAQAREAALPTEMLADWKGASVFLVDDNPVSAQVTAELLQGWEMEIHQAHSVQLAREVLQEMKRQGKNWRLWMLDDHLPEVNGIELLRILRKEWGDASPSPIILLMTSTGACDSYSRNPELGISALLTKPILQADLQNTLFRLSNPVDAETAKSPQSSTTAGPAVNESQKAGMEVLLAEEDLLNQMLVIRLLEKKGHKVQAVRTGREVLTALQGHAYDLVLISQQLPELDGIATSTAVRDLEAQALIQARPGKETSAPFARSRLPIILLTLQSLQDGLPHPAIDECLEKPIIPKELYQSVLRWGGGARNPSIPEDREVFDFKAAIHNAGGDELLFREMVRLFLVERPRLLERLKEAAGKKDQANLVEAVYTLKGAACSFFSRTLEEGISAVELAAQDADWGIVDQALPLLEVALARLIEQLLKFKEAPPA